MPNPKPSDLWNEKMPVERLSPKKPSTGKPEDKCPNCKDGFDPMCPTHSIPDPNTNCPEKDPFIPEDSPLGQSN